MNPARWLLRRLEAAAAKRGRQEARQMMLAALEDRVNELHTANGGDNHESRATARLYHQLKKEWGL